MSPFPGATTGTGGRIRDVQCAGRGSHVIAGTAGYSFGNLLIPGEHTVYIHHVFTCVRSLFVWWKIAMHGVLHVDTDKRVLGVILISLFVCWFICLPHLFVCLFVCGPVCLSICLSVCLSGLLSVCLFVCLSVFLSVCLSVVCLY